MLIGSVMTKKVVSVTPTMKIEKAADILIKYRIHGIPVINKKREVVGLVTEADFFTTRNGESIYLPQYISLLKKVNPSDIDSRKQKEFLEKIRKAKVADIMTADCICINKNAPVSKALKILEKNNFNMLPVVNDKKQLAGVVSLSDLIRLIKK